MQEVGRKIPKKSQLFLRILRLHWEAKVWISTKKPGEWDRLNVDNYVDDVDRSPL